MYVYIYIYMETHYTPYRTLVLQTWELGSTLRTTFMSHACVCLKEGCCIGRKPKEAGPPAASAELLRPDAVVV